MKPITILFFILPFCLVATLTNAEVITSPTNSALMGGNRITFDSIPLGYIEDSFHAGTHADGVTFTENTITIDGVTFSNDGDTTYFATGEEPGPSASRVELDGIAIRREGEQFGLVPPSTSSNHVLQQRTENRTPFLDNPGRLNTIMIEFNPPVSAFGLIAGGNQPIDTLEVYNTDNLQIAVISRITGSTVDSTAYLHDRFIGFSIDASSDNKISYLKYGNRNSHDAIWIDNLTYSKSINIPKNFRDRLWRWIPPWVPLFLIAIVTFITIFRRSQSNQPKR
jgi:hypothetical protein